MRQLAVCGGVDKMQQDLATVKENRLAESAIA
jgi:hypothetical protein